MERPRRPELDYRFGAVVGLGGSMLLGGNGKAYAPGLTEQLELEVNPGAYASVYLGLAHAWHKLTDSRPYFPDDEVLPGTLQGGQTFVVPEIGARFGFRLRGANEEAPFRAWPLFRISLGCATTFTHLSFPSFQGSIPYTSTGYSPQLGLGLGAELRFRPNLSLLPEVRMSLMGYEDGSEDGGSSDWGIETRLHPTLSLRALW